MFASQTFSTKQNVDGIVYGDPFDAKTAQAIQAAASDTWQDRVAAGFTDLAYSMMAPGVGAGTAALKASRAAKAIETGADAERIAQRLASVGVEGITPGSKAGAIGDELLSRPKNPDTMIGRMADSVQKTDGVHDIDTMSQYLGPMMEDATPGARVAIADVWTQANKMEDPAMRTQVKINAMLAAHGSGTARAALIEDFPLLAKNLEEMTGNPRGVALASDLVDARRLGASDDTVNGVLERHYSLASDKAEVEALRRQVEIDHSEAKVASEIRNSARAGSEDRKVAEQMLSEQRSQVDLSRGFLKSREAQASANAATAVAAKPGLTRANHLLNEVMSLGESEIATGRVIPTALDTVKTRLRLMAGDEVEMRYGDANTPVIVKSLPSRLARWSMAPAARGSISLVEPDLGAAQLGDALRRSGVYTPAEVKDARIELLSTDPAKRQDVVGRHQQQMLERIALKHFPDADNPAQALKHAKEVTQAAVKHWGEGNDWVVRHADEQRGQGRVMYRTTDGNVVSVDEAMLQSHLADSAPLLDPEVFDRALTAHGSTIRNNLSRGWGAFVDANDAVTALWKHGALLRPGLAVRAALDTELRAAALMGTTGTVMQATVAAANMAKNARSAVARVLMRSDDVAKAAQQRLSVDLRPVSVDIGGGKRAEMAFARSADERTANQTAMTKGADSPWKFYFTETEKHLNKFRTQRANWARFDADSPHWVSSYVEYAEQLMASPTARWLVKHRDEQIDLGDLMGSDAFKREFDKVAQPKGFTRWEFARQVLHEVESMFPDGHGHLADAVQAHTLTPKMVEQSFPKGTRFDIPGPQRSVIDNTWMDTMRNLTGKAYRAFLDKPDMWMARNPAGTSIYRSHLQREVAAMRRNLPEGESLTARDLDLADRRARTKAISTVRRTFFDTTRHTAMHRQVARVSPFFAAWEDAMISWGRLIYDDPRRLVKLSGAYNAAGTVNPYLPQPLLVDNNGKPLRRGESHDNGSYIAVPFKIKGTQMRIRLEALNSIAQGEVWWLPGFGPQATIATSQVLNRFVPDDVVLDMVGTDNWLGKTILKSMYLDGEIPPADLGTTAGSVMPSTLRNLYKDIWGSNFAANLQRNANYRIAQATKNGEKLDDAQLKRIYDDAGKTAKTAAIVRAISGGGLGLTGTATVDGQFYAEQMRNFEAIPREQLKKMGFGSPEEYFSHLYPEAADLDMHLSKNDTGIQASVNAQKSATHLKGVLSDHPADVGWMVLGRENVNRSGQDDFSRTAYNMQVASGDRKKRSAEEIEQQGRAAVGWRKWRAAQADLASAAQEMGVSVDDPLIADTKRAYKQLLMQQNAAFASEVTDLSRKSDYYYSQAKALSQDPRVKNRSDMVAFRDYDQARQEILDQLGLTTLSGTGAESVAGATLLRQVGERLAAKDYGFQQMWERFLSNETEQVDGQAPTQPEKTQEVLFGG